MENGVVTVLYFLQKEEDVPSSHFMTFGTPSSCNTMFYSADGLVLGHMPLPIAYFFQILAVLCDVLFVLYQLVVHLLD